MRLLTTHLIVSIAIAFSAAMSAIASQNEPAKTPAFEVATIKPGDPNSRGRVARMQSAHQWSARNYTVRFMVAAAYNLPPRAISGGPDWIDSDPYDILATTPGENRPGLDEQMLMLRNLLTERFQLKFHREQRELPVYTLSALKTGPKLNDSAAPEDAQPALVNTVFPGEKILLPARNATMSQFASMMQRAVLDRPVLDKTGLSGRYDFDLEWTPDDTQFGGNLPPVSPENARKPDLFAALQQQLGLRLESARAPVDAIVIDSVQRPPEN
jgi:uncharacterized protein (TIGR03435 family)